MFNWLLTFIQKQAIYGNRTTEDIVVPEGFTLVEFEDSKTKQTHRYLHKEGKSKDSSIEVFFGGSDLDLNSRTYTNILKNLLQLAEK